jgi:hypothetical protein
MSQGDLFGASSPPSHDPGGKVRLRVGAGVVSDAGFSPCGRYRYWLERRFDGLALGDGPAAVHILMNPSTADIDFDDPTVRGCMERGRLWGFGSVVILNAFAYRATNPKRLMEVDDPVGPDNDATIVRFLPRAGRLVVGWGELPKPLRGRGDALAGLLQRLGAHPLCFGVNKSGAPRHPLFQRRDAVLEPWPPA